MARQRSSGGGDINDCGNNTDFNRGSRDSASDREMAGMKELARPSGLGRESTTGNGNFANDTPHVATNDDTWTPLKDEGDR